MTDGRLCMALLWASRCPHEDDNCWCENTTTHEIVCKERMFCSEFKHAKEGMKNDDGCRSEEDI